MPTEGDVIEELKKRYPTYAWAIDIPEIRNLLLQAKQTEDAGTAWDPDELTSKIQQTNWWRSTEDSVKTWQELANTRPGEAEGQRREREAELWDLTRTTGVTISPEAVRELAERSLRLGWSTQSPQLIDSLATMAHYNPGVGKEPTSMATQMAEIRTKASDYMVRISDEESFNFTRRIMAGELKAEDLDTYFREQAKSKFPTLIPYLDNGITPKQFFAPHRQEIASLLEISPDQVDLENDPMWSRVISTPSEDGKTLRPMTISETQRLARGDDRWKSTRQGQSTAAQAAEGILTMFGKVAS